MWRCACDKSFVRWDKFLKHKCAATAADAVTGIGTYTCQCKAAFSSRESFEAHHKTEIGKAGRKPKNGRDAT